MVVNFATQCSDMRKLKNSELNRLTVEEFKESEKLKIVLVLDNIRSLNNIGSIFRTADSFRIEKIYLCGITGVPPHREIQKTALGATESMEWQYFNDVKDSMLQLKTEGYRVLAVEQTEKSTSLEKFTLDDGKKLALVFGNEIHGVSDNVIELVDECIEIPQFGTKHSFNVAVSAGIVLWHLSNLIRK